jgi:hypothetical protein
MHYSGFQEEMMNDAVDDALGDDDDEEERYNVFASFYGK